MHQEEFSKLFQETVKAMDMLLINKGAEYSGTEDRLANFKRGATLTGTKPLTCLFIYMSKHYDSIATYVRKKQRDEPYQLTESIEGRLDDLMNYCLLAKALIQEEKSWRGAQTEGLLAAAKQSQTLNQIASTNKGIAGDALPPGYR